LVVSNCNCGWLPLLLLGLLGLAAAARAARAAAGCRCCSGWLPLLAAAAARAGAAGCRCVPVPPRSPHARTSSTAASRLALAAPLAAARAGAAGCRCCCSGWCGWLPLLAARAGAAGCRCCSGWCCWLPLLLGLLGLVRLAAAAGCSGWCGWLPLLAARAGAAGCRCWLLGLVRLATAAAARAGAAGCHCCCSGWCGWLPLLLLGLVAAAAECRCCCCWLPLLLLGLVAAASRLPPLVFPDRCRSCAATNFLATNFLATNFLATNFHHDGIDLRLDLLINQQGQSIRAIFFETIVRKSEKLDATNGESKPARGASTRRGPPPRRGARAKPQRLFNLSTEVSMMQQTARTAHEHTMRTSRRKIFKSAHSPPHVDKLPPPV
jgi:hypothetical protein